VPPARAANPHHRIRFEDDIWFLFFTPPAAAILVHTRSDITTYSFDFTLELPRLSMVMVASLVVGRFVNIP
jgi:hypothetical protein